MNKAYERINWQNKPSTVTKINATNLNKIDLALDTIDDRVVALDSSAVSDINDLSDVNISSATNGQVLKYDSQNDEWVNANESGSVVSVTQKTSTGTNIADITIDGTTTQLFAPTSGGSSSLSGLSDVDVSSITDEQVLRYNSQTSKWENSDEEVGDTVSWTQVQSTGTKIAEIDINGTSTDVYAPTSGGASSLSGLSDVTLTTPTNNQVLKYDSTSSKWINANESGGGGLTDRTFNVASTDWEQNQDSSTNTDYPYIAEITTAYYSNNSKPIWQMNGVGTIPTLAEQEVIGLILEAVFSSSGIILYAIDEPTESLVLEVKGE